MPTSVPPKIALTNEERQTLERWAVEPNSTPAFALRCGIVLACSEGGTTTATATELRVRRATVARWRTRFIADRLNGLHDRPRPGGPRAITDEMVASVIIKTLKQTPPEATRWSTRSMAAATGMSQSAISRIWRTAGLKPHLLESVKLSLNTGVGECPDTPEPAPSITTGPPRK
jgi:transposase